MEAVATEPFIVHCEKCGADRQLGWYPMQTDVFAALAKLPCASCGSRKMYMGKKPKETADGDAIGWLLNGDTGISSETMWTAITGHPINKPRWAPGIPHDPDDFGRCYRLMRTMPTWGKFLPKVAAAYPMWVPFIEAWDELVGLYEEELPSGTCPKLYARLQALGKVGEQMKETA